MPTLYLSTERIVADLKALHGVTLTTRTVRTYLRETFPAHEVETWWRLATNDYERALRELAAGAKAMPGQPRRGLKRMRRSVARVREIRRQGQTFLFA